MQTSREIEFMNNAYMKGNLHIEVFNCSLSENWTSNSSYNQAFIEHNGAVINQTIEKRGYIYPNQIIELFGFKWDPKNSNYVITRPIDFEYFVDNEPDQNEWLLVAWDDDTNDLVVEGDWWK